MKRDGEVTMRTVFRKLLAGLLIMGMIVTAFPISYGGQAYAATKGKVKSVKVTNLPAKTLTLKKGMTKKLKVKVTTSGKISKKVKYTSSNKKVATISSKGVIKAKKNGTTKITIKSKAQPKKKVVIKVTVGKPVTSVKLKKKSIKLTVGNSAKLKVTVSPKKASNKKIVWKSSNKNVAKVSKTGNFKSSFRFIIL